MEMHMYMKMYVKTIPAKIITEMRGDIFFEIKDVGFSSSFFLNRDHHTTANAPTPTLTQPTTQHIPTHINTSPTSSTDTGPLHSKWREACTVKPRQLFLA